MGRKWSRVGPKQLRRLQCRLSQSTQSVVSGANPAILYATEVDDPYDLHSTAANTERVTITRPGWYRLQGTTFVSGTAGTIRVDYITKNGAPGSGTTLVEQRGLVNGAQPQLAVVDVLLTSGDFVAHYYFHDNGSNQTLTSTFEVYWLRPGP